ncbi:MAG TPA: cardiolipin synthase [Desulfobacteria bacterium]|nr:cardiolipin synthase [Desulfobacteria bacterium]
MMDVTLTTTLFFTAHWLIVIGLSIRVIMRRRPVGVSLAWLTVIFSIPFVGAILYFLVGESRIGDQYLARAAKIHDLYGSWQITLQKRAHREKPPAGTIAMKGLQLHAEKVAGFPTMRGNKLRLMDQFETVFDSIIEDINNAESTCHLEFYIWTVGGKADEVVEALLGAAKRGVICRVLVDAVGSKDFLRSELVQRLHKSGIHVVASLPVGPLRMLMTRADLRNHRKIVVIDGEIAYTGSQNLVDPRFFKQEEGVGQWIDAMVRMEGPSVEALAGTFIEDWELDTGEGLEALEKTSDIRSIPEKGVTPVQVVPSGPAIRPEIIHQLLLATIYGARKRLLLTTPYFVPDESLMTALISAAHRGVDVTIVVPAEVDSRFVHYASRSLFDNLMSAGIRIAAFKGGLLHTKSITVDDEISVFGTVNLDMRSLWLNFEISLFIYDLAFTKQLREMQMKYLSHSGMINLAEWRQRSVIQKFTENAAQLVGPLL